MTALASTAVVASVRAGGAQTRGPSVSTLIGTGAPGLSDTAVANPYGLVFGPDGALYFCDLDNQRPSPEKPAVPVPAKVEMTRVRASTLRTTWLSRSAM